MIGAATVAGLIWSWGCWPDAVIDFGRELYVPWRLSEGQVLYRDIETFNGPLSPYGLALWFTCFGVSLRALVFSNILFLAIVLSLTYVIFRTIAGRTAALLAGLTFVGVFAFSQLHGVGNFNWICPYSHELTHGLGLSLLSIYGLFLFAKKGNLIWLFISGFVLGLVFLTKGEVFLAAAAACGFGLSIRLCSGRSLFQKRAKALALWTGGLLLPALITFMLLAPALSAAEALRAVMGTWFHVFDAAHRQLPFFRWVMGTLNPAESVLRVSKWVGGYLLVFALAAGLAFFSGRDKKDAYRRAGIGFIVPVGIFAFLWLKYDRNDWFHIPQPWQVFTFFLVILFYLQVRRNLKQNRAGDASILRLMMAVFAFVLLWKMILNVRVWHYGFTLALPAALMVVAALWQWIPELIAKKGGSAVVFRAVFLALWLVFIIVPVNISSEIFSQKKYQVGSGGDVFRTDEKGKLFFDAAQFLKKNMRPGDTLAVIPEGIMMNYLLRAPAPPPFVIYNPPTMILFGEQKMRRTLQSSPPDWIVFVHRDDSAFGARFFGQDYGRSIWNWVAANYAFKNRFGALPFQTEQFGILIGKDRGQKRGGNPD